MTTFERLKELIPDLDSISWDGDCLFLRFMDLDSICNTKQDYRRSLLRCASQKDQEIYDTIEKIEHVLKEAF